VSKQPVLKVAAVRVRRLDAGDRMSTAPTTTASAPEGTVTAGDASPEAP
jgi:hypothetical protein